MITAPAIRADSILRDQPGQNNIFVNNDERHKRGMNVWTWSELMPLSGYDRFGNMVQETIQSPIFILTPDEREEIFRKSSMVFGVITSRMNRIASLKWTINFKKRDLERIVYMLKSRKQIYDEYEGTTVPAEMLLRLRQVTEIRKQLPDIRMDLSNFDNSIRRLERRAKMAIDDRTEEIQEWIKTPSSDVTFKDFRKKWVKDLHLHGVASAFKKFGEGEKDFYILPGGSVYPLRGEFVGQVTGYAQMIPGYTPRIYFQDEISFDSYVPNSNISYGNIPIEALINKIAESMLFDEKMAKSADGSKPPEKVVVFGDNRVPFGDMTGGNPITVPMNTVEKKRVEETLTQYREYAVAVLTGVGTPTVLDLTRADTVGVQMQRQDKLLRDCALVFNMSNMEVNLAGGEFTSGKETSETQGEIEEGKGTQPVAQQFKEFMDRDIIRPIFGDMFEFEFEISQTEQQRVQLDQQKLSAGYTMNEVRRDRGDDAIPGEEYDKPQGGGTPIPDGTQTNPMNVKQI